MRTPAIALTAAALVCLTTSLHAAPITSLTENFNELTPALGVTSAGAFSTIGGTNVDIVGGSLYGSLCASPEGGNCIDMDGTYGNPVGQLQSNSEFAAGTYDLSFDLIGNQRGATTSTTVTFGSYDQTFTLASGDVTSGIVVDELVTLTAPGYLEFVSNDPSGSDEGQLLDNVVVSSTAATPEPSAFLLLGTGLIGVAGALRRRFA